MPRLVAAGEDLNLRLLTKSHEDTSESVFVFGGGLSGHRRKVNDLAFGGGFGEDSYRYLASVSGAHNPPCVGPTRP